MRPSRSPAAGWRNESTRRSAPAHRVVRAASRLAVDLAHREEPDAAAPREACGVGQGPRRWRAAGCPAAGHAGGSGTGDARSSMGRATATPEGESIDAALCPVRPAARSASPGHGTSRRSRCPARPLIDPDLDLISRDEDDCDQQQRSAAMVSAQLGRIFRSSANTTADDVGLLLYLYQARSARPSSPVASDGQPGGTTRKEGGQRFQTSGLRRNVAGVDAVERSPEPRTNFTPHPASLRLPLRGTPSTVTRGPARTGSRACRRLHIRDVDEGGADRRQLVDGLGDESVDGAGRRSVAP